jgi:hypothetical protein
MNEILSTLLAFILMVLLPCYLSHRYPHLFAVEREGVITQQHKDFFEIHGEE